MNILLITDPKIYQDYISDVPQFYCEISRRHDLNLFHTSPNKAIQRMNSLSDKESPFKRT